jgi:hypothetical protein
LAKNVNPFVKLTTPTHPDNAKPAYANRQKIRHGLKRDDVIYSSRKVLSLVKTFEVWLSDAVWHKTFQGNYNTSAPSNININCQFAFFICAMSLAQKFYHREASQSLS